MGRCKTVTETNSNKTGTFLCYLKMLIDPYLCWKNKPFNTEQLSELNTEAWESLVCHRSLWQNRSIQSCVSTEVNGTSGVL